MISEYLYNGNFEKALYLTNRCLELDPQNTFLLNNLAYIKYFQNHFNECYNINNKIIELDPQDAYAYKGLGLACVKLKKIDQGIKFLIKAIELDPSFFDAYYDLALVLFENNQNTEAEKILQNAPISTKEEQNATIKFLEIIKKKMGPKAHQKKKSNEEGP